MSLVIFLTACGASAPPIGLAPNTDIIKKAIALQVERTQQQVSQQLQVKNSEFKIVKIHLKQVEPLYIGKLATYHLLGTYELNLNLPNQKVKQKNNEFELYLQRQKEGKTWRWLKKEMDESDSSLKWFSFLVH
ncbi:hypothetical protein [Lusitaniella coriacea]|uniref:hypothetical protein n=1 Tax=Cyanophyceae TaxID=3028117 RepID=UPI001E2F3FF6|nr:hypothetical protein [Lusitaniella coriacea]